MQSIIPKILIGDDHGMIRRGLSMLIHMEIGAFPIAEADTCAKVIAILEQGDFTHLILDVIFGDGNSLEIIPTINKHYPSLRILIFSMQPLKTKGNAFNEMQIRYFLSKSSDNDTVVKVLTNFINNDLQIEESNHLASVVNPFEKLSSRELQVLHYMLNGMSTKQISEMLSLPMNSVSTLKKRMSEKTGASNLKELIDLCTKYKISF